MDWTTIIVALISCIGTALGSAYGIKKSTSLVEYRLSQLEEKVDKHNNVIERTFHLEEDTRVLEERIKVANHRIDDLEKGRQ